MDNIIYKIGNIKYLLVFSLLLLFTLYLIYIIRYYRVLYKFP